MKKKQVITDDFVITSEIAKGIHFWLHKMGDKVNQFQLGIDRVAAIQEVVKEGLQKGKDFIEKHKDRLNGNTPKWTAKVLFDAGYKQQCMVLEPFQAETQEEAQTIAEAKVAAFFEESPNAVIFEVKVKKTT